MTLARQNVRCLRQGRRLIEQLEPSLYAEKEGRGSVGAHLRHCIDYYRCFLRGLDDGRIDYDARERQPEIETDPETGAAALDEIMARLETLDGPAGRPLQVKVDSAAWGDPALIWSGSTLHRELQFLLSHTVHHYALIAQHLRRRGREVSDDFGVAPSTLEHREAHVHG